MGTQRALAPFAGQAGLVFWRAGLARCGLPVGLSGWQQGTGAGGARAVLAGGVVGLDLGCRLGCSLCGSQRCLGQC